MESSWNHYDLLKNKNKFCWTPYCDSTFNKIKELVQNANILVHPHFQKPFVVGFVVSIDRIVFYLGQVENNNIQYITFGDRTLSETERRYPVLDKELLPVFYAVKSCYVYLCSHDYKCILIISEGHLRSTIQVVELFTRNECTSSIC